MKENDIAVITERVRSAGGILRPDIQYGDLHITEARVDEDGCLMITGEWNGRIIDRLAELWREDVITALLAGTTK